MTWWPEPTAAASYLRAVVKMALDPGEWIGFCSLGYGLLHPLRHSDSYRPNL